MKIDAESLKRIYFNGNVVKQIVKNDEILWNLNRTYSAFKRTIMQSNLDYTVPAAGIRDYDSEITIIVKKYNSKIFDEGTGFYPAGGSFYWEGKVLSVSLTVSLKTDTVVAHFEGPQGMTTFDITITVVQPKPL